MARTKQLRSLKPRERLLSCARKIVFGFSYEALRLEEVVSDAEVAKGTFFAHFRDEDALMDILIVKRIDALFDDLETVQNFGSVEHVVESIMPFLSFISSQRYVFDIFLRSSGALAVKDVGKIAESIVRYDHIHRKIEWWPRPSAHIGGAAGGRNLGFFRQLSHTQPLCTAQRPERQTPLQSS